MIAKYKNMYIFNVHFDELWDIYILIKTLPTVYTVN